MFIGFIKHCFQSLLTLLHVACVFVALRFSLGQWCSPQDQGLGLGTSRTKSILGVGLEKKSWSWSWSFLTKKSWEFEGFLLAITIEYFNIMIMLLWLPSVDRHRVACIAYFVTSNHIYFSTKILNYWVTLNIETFNDAWEVLVLVLRRNSSSWKKKIKSWYSFWSGKSLGLGFINSFVDIDGSEWSRSHSVAQLILCVQQILSAPHLKEKLSQIFVMWRCEKPHRMN